MQLHYVIRDPRDVEIEREIPHFGNTWRRMREILGEWKDLFLENVNQGAAFSEDQPACNDISS